MGSAQGFNTDILMVLKRRNLEYLDGFNSSNLVLDITEDETRTSRFYELMKKYSFRLVLRDIIKLRNSFKKELLTKFSDLPAITRYIDELLDLGIIEQIQPEEYRLIQAHVDTFGDTLEWFIARVFEHEFKSTAGWGIKLHTHGVGGDYDVLACVEHYLVYVETKSSPPAHIELQSIVEFLARIDRIAPHMAILLVDTELRMRDKIIPMCEQALKARGLNGPMRLISGELFQFNHQIYVINSKTDLIANLQKVLGDFLSVPGIKL